MKDDEYKCAGCGRKFKKGWSDEEARAEEKENFGRNDPDAVILCDDCYTKWEKDFYKANAKEVIHFEIKRIVKRKFVSSAACGIQKGKRTVEASCVTCPACMKATIKMLNARQQKQIKKLASKVAKNARS